MFISNCTARRNIIYKSHRTKPILRIPDGTEIYFILQNLFPNTGNTQKESPTYGLMNRNSKYWELSKEVPNVRFNEYYSIQDLANFHQTPVLGIHVQEHLLFEMLSRCPLSTIGYVPIRYGH